MLLEREKEVIYNIETRTINYTISFETGMRACMFSFPCDLRDTYLHLASANVSVLEMKLSHPPLVVDAVEGSEASKSHSLDVLTAEPSAPAFR